MTLLEQYPTWYKYDTGKVNLCIESSIPKGNHKLQTGFRFPSVVTF